MTSTGLRDRAARQASSLDYIAANAVGLSEVQRQSVGAGAEYIRALLASPAPAGAEGMLRAQPAGELAPSDWMLVVDLGENERGIRQIRTVGRVFANHGAQQAETDTARIVAAWNATAASPAPAQATEPQRILDPSIDCMMVNRLDCQAPNCGCPVSADPTPPTERRQGRSKLVYDKATRTIVTVATPPAEARELVETPSPLVEMPATMVSRMLGVLQNAAHAFITLQKSDPDFEAWKTWNVRARDLELELRPYEARRGAWTAEGYERFAKAVVDESIANRDATIERLERALKRIKNMNTDTFEAMGPLMSCVEIARAALSASAKTAEDRG